MPFKRKTEAETWTEEYCPNVMQKLNEANKKAVGCHVTWSGGARLLVQTSTGGYELVVDLTANTCAYKKWQLSGVPCFHVVACLNSKGFDLKTGLHVYNHIVEPINGKEEWIKTSYKQPLPPNVKPSTRRPKTRRNKKSDIKSQEPNSTKLIRKKSNLRCGSCNKWRHNKRTCGTKPVEEGATEVGAPEGEGHEGGSVTSNQEEINAGASQPTTQPIDSQGGVFGSEAPPPTEGPSACGVAPKTWQKQKKTITTRAEILRARSREKN